MRTALRNDRTDYTMSMMCNMASMLEDIQSAVSKKGPVNVIVIKDGVEMHRIKDKHVKSTVF